MATFIQNIRNIRGEATKGSIVRSSIAEALQQSVHLTYQDVAVPYPPSDDIQIQITPTVVGSNDYVLSFSKTS